MTSYSNYMKEKSILYILLTMKRISIYIIFSDNNNHLGIYAMYYA